MAATTITNDKGRNSSNRRSRKKRRTEVSSSEESDSSSSDAESSNDKDEVMKDANVTLQEEEENLLEQNIDDMELPTQGTKSTEDAITTRMKLEQLKSSNFDESDAISSDEWLKKMLSQYGDDLDQLRQASDFKEDSVALIAQLLRESGDVFKNLK
ncbi:hypothetical protein DAMA08_050930 [Martiniozyma asiatica (nom. inval.)]|nr:hypothetical protein DAMA08_050930 [Martiniozyma asiatica]